MKKLNRLKTKISPELKLVAILCLPKLNAEHVDNARLLLKQVNHQYLEELINHHRIWPCTCHNIDAYFPEIISSDFFQRLRGKSQSCREFTKRQFIEYTKLLQAFKRANIPVKTLKGFPLARKLFGDINLRFGHDIDLMIPQRFVEEANRVLVANGYTSEIYEELPACFQKKYFNAIKDLSYYNRQKILVELHTRPSPYHTGLSKIMTGEHSCRFDEMLVEYVYLCSHAAISTVLRIKWLLDVVLFHENYINTLPKGGEGVFKLAKETDETSAVVLCAVLSHLLFNRPITTEERQYFESSFILPKMAERVLFSMQKNPLKVGVLALIRRLVINIVKYRKLRSKLKVVSTFLSPNARDFSLYSAVPTKNIGVYYFYKPFRLIYEWVILRKKTEI